MAQVLGESGRYVSREAIKNFDRQLATAFIMLGVLGVSGGFVMGLSVPLRALRWPITLPVFLVCLTGLFVIYRIGMRLLGKFDRQRMAMRRGASGEQRVGLMLADFPNDTYVIHDLATPYGNLDHVVVGPTGVYLIDTKNWRGVVAADGNGELLLNGKPTDKPFIRQMSGRVMGIKDRVKALCGLDPYFRALFVFTSARVEADWGKTGHVHCMRDDQMWDYIVENKMNRKLPADAVQRIAQAFLGVAVQDRGFEMAAGGASTAAAPAPSK